MNAATTSVHRQLVVIVDPDTDTRAMYRTALQAYGFDTDEAADGREALVKTFVAHPSAIVLETRLPFIDGYELCRILAHEPRTADVPVVFVSGDAYSDQVQRAWNAGADAVLTKPCLPETLVDEICRLINPPHDVSRAPIAAKSTMARASLPADPPRRPPMSRTYARLETTTPPLTPLPLHCPSCDRLLVYERSYVGGVSPRHPEQWDYFECPSCGTFEYRQRTKTLRRVVDVGVHHR